MSSIQYLLGKTLGKYEVIEHIGHGGMSEVYRGQQVQLDRMVAIKVLHPFLADEEGFVVRFQREARIVATLRHPNIVQVYDFDYNDELDIYYMVMEYIDGPTLKDLMENAPCTPEETARIGAAIADALDYAHQRSMIHRDIKPANIMFLEEQQPVLTDFGIAKMLTLSGLTASGAMVGTPAYMAPEIGLGKPGTAASDIYSLSVVLYQAVTGTLPFTAETPMGMVMQHINKAPLHPSAYTPEVPSQLEDIILRGLEKDPDHRYATAGNMALALRQALGLELPLSTPPEALVDKAPEPSPNATIRQTDDTPSPAPAGLQDQVTEATNVTPQTPLQTEQPKHARRWFHPLVLLRSAFLLIAAIAIGGSIWYGIQDSTPSLVRRLFATGSDAPPKPAVPSPTIPVNTPIPAEATPTAPPERASTATPVKDQLIAITPTPCSLRVHVESVQIEPDATVAPGTPMVVYVSLRNSGSCIWPQDAALDLVEGRDLVRPGSFPAEYLAPGETIQFLIPMDAPEDFGVYALVWELRVNREPLGKGGSGRVEFEIAVEDVPVATALASEEIVFEDPTLEPLAIETPSLLSWELLPDRDLWRGTVALTVTGGTGDYRLYQDRISADTEVSADALTVEWQRCRPFPLELWVLSGEDVLNWIGQVPPPTDKACP